MTTPPLHWRDITDNALIDRLQDAGAEAIVRTPFWQKRWNSLTSAAQVVLQLANIVALGLAGAHWGWHVAFAVVVGVAEVIMQARTRTPVTPGVVTQITEAAAEQLDRARRPVGPTADQIAFGQTAAAHADAALTNLDAHAAELPFFDRD